MNNPFLILLFMLTGCSAVGGVSATATSSEPPNAHCEQGICIQRTYLTLTKEGDGLRAEFALTDELGKVEVGNNYAFSKPVMFALYSGDTYLIGLKPDLGLFSCYTGNDFPWSNGKLAAACGIQLPVNQMAERVKAGQTLRVEAIGFGDYKQLVEVQQGK